MPEAYRRSRGKKSRKPLVVKLIMAAILLVLIFAAAGMPLLKRWLPSGEYKDLNEWFEVSGVQTKIYLDSEPEHEYTAAAYDGEVYLPYEYVFDKLNERFYWNENEQLLTYTLPDEVLDFSLQHDTDQAAGIIMSEEGPYISLKLIEQYTNISHTAYLTDADGAEETAKRVFIYHGGTGYDRARLKHNAKVRTAADKKAPILADISKNEMVSVTETSAEWSRVITDSGFVGYIYDDKLEMLGEEDCLIIPDTYAEPEVPYVTMDEKVVMGWQAVYSSAANENLEALYEGTGGTINVITPQWLQISGADGSLTDFSDREYVERAHSLGLKVWASVDNINQPGGVNDFSTRDFFADTEKRRGFIAVLMDKADEYGYDGFNLDFEGLPADAGQSFTQFFRELSVECHKKGLALSIDNYVPYAYNDHYNLKEQGVFADYVIIMGYDEHTGSDIGPVASIGYTEYGITEALKKVPAERLIAAVPLYTRVWRTNDGVTTSEAMGIRESEQYVSDNAIMLSWDEEAGAYYGETMIGTGQIQIWLEENESLKLKTDKIREYGLTGIAAWRLGFEPQDVWDVLDLNRE